MLTQKPQSPYQFLTGRLSYHLNFLFPEEHGSKSMEYGTKLEFSGSHILSLFFFCVTYYSQMICIYLISTKKFSYQGKKKKEIKTCS